MRSLAPVRGRGMRRVGEANAKPTRRWVRGKFQIALTPTLSQREREFQLVESGPRGAAYSAAWRLFSSWRRLRMVRTAISARSAWIGIGLSSPRAVITLCCASIISTSSMIT